MNFYASHDTAENGMAVNSTVELLLPEDDETFAKLPWRSRTFVDWCPMCHGHFATLAAAKADAEMMHAAYLEVHAR